IHDIDIRPTPETLSLFITYTSFFINPRSVSNYLSGICQELEPYFEDVRTARCSRLVNQTLKGAMKVKGTNISRKEAITVSQINDVIRILSPNPSYDDKLFLAILIIGFFALLRLGEMTIPDDKRLRNPKKEILRSSVFRTTSSFGFTLPGSKTDRFFEGDKIIVRANVGDPNPIPFFFDYLSERDNCFPFHIGLFVTSNGHAPTNDWFTKRLRSFLPKEYSGHSLRAGGATWLASIGTPANIIQ
ncbi:hypothetical protein BKA70DRAFT_1083626, partial [Coprinopsis sp. MPI-PUGE-AT-0042]